MLRSLKVDNLQIGVDCPVFVIAEAGVNHNGDVDLARQLIIEAQKAGADCVKFQTFKAEKVIMSDAPKAAYQLETTDPKESQIEMLRKLELDLDVYPELINLCKRLGIIFISTPYNPADVDFLDEIGIPAFKLASIHIAEPSFLTYVASKGKPMVVSTGMATLAEVDVALRAIRATGNEQVILLQCTTNYPSELADVNMRAMQTMQQAFDVLVGYSDHTEGNLACCASVAMGAVLIEKHFTLDKTMEGPDHKASSDPAEFSSLVQDIRNTELLLGHSRKEPCAAESRNIAGMRRSLVADVPIRSGELIIADKLLFKRPGTGLSPTMLDQIVGRKATQDIQAGELLTWEMCGGRL